MDFKVTSRTAIYIGSEIVQTQITMQTESPFNFLTCQIDGDCRTTDESVVVDLAKEAIFKAWFVDRAMPEAIQKVDEMDAKLKEVDAFLTKAKEDFQAITEAGEMSQGTLVELGEMVFGHDEKINVLEDKVYALENRNAFGD